MFLNKLNNCQGSLHIPIEDAEEITVAVVAAADLSSHHAGCKTGDRPSMQLKRWFKSADKGGGGLEGFNASRLIK